MMKAFGMCFNWKVLVGLGAVGMALFAFVSPQTALAALPFLLFAACPLSMMFMMGSMKNMNGGQEGSACAMGGNANQQKLTPEEQLAQLKAQQQELAEQIALMEREPQRQPQMHVQPDSVSQAS
jgi:hypothetical protein